MDNTTQSTERAEVFKNTWKSKLQQIVSEKTRDPFLQEARYLLPWGFANLRGHRKTEGFYVRELDVEDEHTLGDYAPDIQVINFFTEKKRHSHSWASRTSIQKDYPMVLFVKPNSMGIRQAFRGVVKDSTFIKFKDNYFYKWDNRSKLITISYTVGSLDTSNLLDNCEALFEESKNFYVLYTEEGKKILKNMV